MSRQTSEFQDALLSHARTRRFTRGETIIELDTDATDLHFLLRGAVGVAVAKPGLDLATIDILSAGRWFGEQSAIAPLPSLLEYSARTPCSTLSIPHDTLKTLRLSSGEVSAIFAELLAISLRTQCDVTASLVSVSVAERIRGRLRTLADLAASVQPGCEVILQLRQEDLADITCTARSSVSKVLGELVDEKVIRISYGKIIVLQPQLLI